MNFYNPLSNVIDDPDANIGSDYENIAQYHMEKARAVFMEIAKTNPSLAEKIADFVMQAILAANAYNHDMFERRNPQDEDFDTRLRKNR